MGTQTVSVGLRKPAGAKERASIVFYRPTRRRFPHQRTSNPTIKANLCVPVVLSPIS
jgi:hypothetical protein